MHSRTRTQLLTESSTSDGKTLYIVFGATPDSEMEDVLYTVPSEQSLFNVIRGSSSEDLAHAKVFVSRTAAEALAKQRLRDAKAESVT